MVKVETHSKEDKENKKHKENNKENKNEKDKANINEEKSPNIALEEIQKKDAKIKELEEALVKQKELAESYYASLQRVAADLDNVQKRVTKEKAEIIEYANSKLILELIDIYENFERALQSAKKEGDLKKILDGLEMIRKQFWQLLEREGLRPINAVGSPFDPFKEEAMLRVVKDDLPENTVIEEYQKGYTYKSRVLRTAKVAVSYTSKPEQKPDTNEINSEVKAECNENKKDDKKFSESKEHAKNENEKRENETKKAE